MRQDGLSGQQLDNLLNSQSGLLGISGISGDMRQIIAAMKTGNSRARLAFYVFVHRLPSNIGAMIGALGGLDCLVFTAGIGENSQEVRAEACATLGFIGVKLDSAKNHKRVEIRTFRWLALVYASCSFAPKRIGPLPKLAGVYCQQEPTATPASASSFVFPAVPALPRKRQA